MPRQYVLRSLNDLMTIPDAGDSSSSEEEDGDEQDEDEGEGEE